MAEARGEMVPLVTKFKKVVSVKNSISGFGKMLSKLDFNEMLTTENLVKNIPFFLFLVMLAMIYIGNTHSVEGTIRRIDKMKSDLKEARWNYMSAKSDLMYKSKQSEVAKAVESLGLKEMTDPPKKIVINEH